MGFERSSCTITVSPFASRNVSDGRLGAGVSAAGAGGAASARGAGAASAWRASKIVIAVMRLALYASARVASRFEWHGSK